jgi:hypothetical protein
MEPDRLRARRLPFMDACGFNSDPGNDSRLSGVNVSEPHRQRGL